MAPRLQLRLSTLVFALPLTIGVGSAHAAAWCPGVIGLSSLAPAAKLLIVACLFLAPSAALFAGRWFTTGLQTENNVRPIVAVAAGSLLGIFIWCVAVHISFAIIVYHTHR
jgi:hypothetical protein